MDFVHFCDDPEACAKSEFTHCAAYYCPFGEPSHFWHDGCGACDVDFIVEDTGHHPPSLMDQMLASAGIPTPEEWRI
jgi:hypothetical protein